MNFHKIIRTKRRGRFIGHMESHLDRKSTRLNSSHLGISYAVFCLKKKKTTEISEAKVKAVLNKLTNSQIRECRSSSSKIHSSGNVKSNDPSTSVCPRSIS